MHSENLQLFDGISWQFETMIVSWNTCSNHETITSINQKTEIHAGNFSWQELSLETSQKSSLEFKLFH